NFSYNNDSIIQKRMNDTLFNNSNVISRNNNKYKSLLEDQAILSSNEKTVGGSKVKKLSLSENMIRLGKMSAEPLEFVDYPTMAKTLLPGIRDVANIFNNDKTLKGWDELNEEQKQAVTNIILPIIFSHTLVHEMGHNLGLRHNFRGSFDRANFYTSKEIYSRDDIIKNKYITAPAYSSIMDYGHSELNGLGLLGKYDIAALRFAYAREAVKLNGQAVKIESTLNETRKQIDDAYAPKMNDLYTKHKPMVLTDDLNKLAEKITKAQKDLTEAEATEKPKLKEKLAALVKEQKDKQNEYMTFLKEESAIKKDSLRSYLYCTDENLNVDVSCDQFDEGTTFTEIALAHYRNYTESLRHRYFRNNRNDFSEYDIIPSLMSSTRMFYKARMIFEMFEIASSMYGKNKMNNGCNSSERENHSACKFIEDIRASSMVISKLFLEILKMPDLTCLVKNKTEASDDKTTLMPLRAFFYGNNLQTQMDHVPTSCFDTKILQAFDEYGLTVMAQAGQYFKNLIEINPKYNNGDYTQLAVRGIWQDKVLAMKFLTKRNISLRMEEGGQGSFIDIPDVKAAVENYILHVTTNVALNDPILFQNPLTGDVYKVPYFIDENYVLPDQMFPVVRQFLGMPAGNTPLNKTLLQIAYTSNKTQDVNYKDEGDKFTENLCVYKKYNSEAFVSTPSKFVQTTYDKVSYGANPNNKIAYVLLSKVKNETEQFNTLNDNRADIDKILVLRFGDKIPEPIFSADEKKVLNGILSIEQLKKVLEKLISLTDADANLSDEEAAALLGNGNKNSVLMASKLGKARLEFLITYKENKMVGQLSVEKLKKILVLIKTLNGRELTPSELTDAVGSMSANLGKMAYKLGEERVTTIIKLKDVAPDNATIEQKFIYSLDKSVLSEFNNGTLKNKISSKWVSLQSMPECKQN
ncbi:MAG: zinc-dependent metalloprotease, partial [Oligoflexia bacterium]|nr:zinc-dependent metalloprotease [Oligoflexia bacterium]